MSAVRATRKGAQVDSQQRYFEEMGPLRKALETASNEVFDPVKGTSDVEYSKTVTQNIYPHFLAARKVLQRVRPPEELQEYHRLSALGVSEAIEAVELMQTGFEEHDAAKLRRGAELYPAAMARFAEATMARNRGN
jgi:hypothetical protein